MNRLLGDARIAAATLATLATALLGYREVFTGLDWWTTPVLCMAAVLAAATVLRQIQFRSALTRALTPWLGSLLFGAAVLALRFGGGNWLELARAGAQEIFLGAAPFALDDPGLFLVSAICALLALVLGWCAFVVRAGILVALAGVAVFISPLLAIVPTFSVLRVGAFVIAVVWLLVETGRPSSGPRERPVAGITVAAIAVVAALVAPSLVPGIADVDRRTSGPGGVFSGDINPMIALGDSLASPQPTEAFHYVTDTTRPGYLRVVTVTALRGKVWGPDPFAAPAENSSDAIPVPAGLTGTQDPVTTEISIDRLDTRWLPVPTPATGVSGLVGEWRWASADQTIRGVNSTTRGQNYTVSSVRNTLVADDLRSSPPASSLDGPERYLALPDGLSSTVTDQAASITANASNAYDQAIALQRFFRSGDFRYDLTAPVADGNGVTQAEVIDAFLQRRSGYCVHFASAMAVMARSLGIPARIALGYLPGTAALRDGQLEYTVRSDQLHAWPELYFEGYGWIGFEPTATRGTATTFAETPSATTPSDTPTAAPTRGPSATPTPSATVRPDGPAATRPGAVTTSALLPLGIAVLVVLVVLLPALVRVLVGRRRRRSDPWAEFRAVAGDLGVPADLADSPRAFAARLAQRGVAGAAIDELVSSVEAHSYARAGADGEHRADPGAAIAQLRAAFSPWQRLWARLVPRSLWDR